VDAFLTRASAAGSVDAGRRFGGVHARLMIGTYRHCSYGFEHCQLKRTEAVWRNTKRLADAERGFWSCQAAWVPATTAPPTS